VPQRLMSTEADLRGSGLSSCVIFWSCSCQFMVTPDALGQLSLETWRIQISSCSTQKVGDSIISSAAQYRGNMP
jgi:hypothetical protein